MRLAPLCAGVALLAAGSGAAVLSAPVPAAAAQSLPAAVRNACDLIASIARATKGVTVQRKTGSFEDEFAGIRRNGCTVSAVGSFAALEGGQDVVEKWRETFERRGWRADLEHDADGPDGTAFAFVSDGVICLFRGQWDGGDDTDPAAPVDDAYQGWGGCAATFGSAVVRSIPP